MKWFQYVLVGLGFVSVMAQFYIFWRIELIIREIMRGDE